MKYFKSHSKHHFYIVYSNRNIMGTNTFYFGLLGLRQSLQVQFPTIAIASTISHKFLKTETGRVWS